MNIEHRHNTHFYLRLHDFVSRQCKHHIAKEFECMKRVGVENVHVDASVRQHMGYLVYVNLHILKHVPLESINVFWRKLHIEEYEVIEEGSETQLD